MKIESYRARSQASKAEKYATRFETGARKRIHQREIRAVQKIFASLDGCATVVDVPSGAGRFLTALSTNGRRVLEVDVALDMLAFGRKRNNAATSGGLRHFVQGDATRLPLAKGSVDCVFCNRLLHHIVVADERAVILRELHRVTRRWVVVSFFDYHSFGTVRKVLKRLKGRKPKYDHEPTRAEFQKEVERAGFRVEEIMPTGSPWVAQKFFVLEKV